MRGRILVVEDDCTARNLCESCLRNEGFEVDLSASVAAGREAIRRSRFDLIVLDLNLPDGDGLDLAMEARRLCQTLPILMMTVRFHPDERVAGFESGATDYLIKPFHPGELIYRIRNIMERDFLHVNHRLDEVGLATQSRFGTWLLDPDTRGLRAGDGRMIDLTHGEFKLLAKLASCQGRVIARDDLMDCVARVDGEGHPRTVDVLISRLRSKIGVEQSIPLHILTIPGIGYRLVVLPRERL